MNFHNAVQQDPSTVNRQAFLVFAVCVAGKKADVTAQKVVEFFRWKYSDETPFEFIRDTNRINPWMPEINNLQYMIEHVKLGKYSQLMKTLPAIAELDVDSCTYEDLLAVPGIGPKTASYFMLYARGEDYPAIDTHMKKFLREIGCKAKDYASQAEWFKSAAAYLGLTIQALDDLVWRRWARNEDIDRYGRAVSFINAYSIER